MPVATLAEALPYVLWITIASLAIGAFAFAVATGWFTDATQGYLRFMAALVAVGALLGFALDGGLPTATALAIQSAPPELDSLRRSGLGGLVIAAIAYAVLVGSARGRFATGVAGLACAGLTVLGAASGWAPTPVEAVPLSVQLGILAAVTGGSTAAVALGHWYLVTPRISIRPLVFQTRLLLAALTVQGLLFVVWTTLGGGIGQGPWDAFTGSSALLVWLRGLVTVAFPLVLCYMAFRTAQTRSMESATGLLYINLAAVLAGTIGAAALYVSSGILV